jgi:hypothetical protein
MLPNLLTSPFENSSILLAHVEPDTGNLLLLLLMQDIPCKGQPRCQVCGGPDRVRDACAATPTCVSFSYQVSTQCGLLKSKAAANNLLTPQRDWIAYAGELVVR